MELGATTFADATTTASKGFSVSTKDLDLDGTITSDELSQVASDATLEIVDLVFEMENLQFDDGFGRTGMEINADDLDFDFEIDDAELLGDILSNVFDPTVADLQSLVPDWVVTEEGSAAAALTELFDADNFFDGGAGTDVINAGGGNDTINPGASSGDANDAIDGGLGDDVLVLDGAKANWTKTVAGSHSGTTLDLNGDGDTSDAGEISNLSSYDEYKSNNGTTDDTSDDFVICKNIEA